MHQNGGQGRVDKGGSENAKLIFVAGAAQAGVTSSMYSRWEKFGLNVLKDRFQE